MRWFRDTDADIINYWKILKLMNAEGKWTNQLNQTDQIKLIIENSMKDEIEKPEMKNVK